jgi:probable biosynthetic protein (TIGR04098 family)
MGTESVLTLHRITPADNRVATEPVDYRELHDAPHAKSIYVENYNRWVARSKHDSNVDLIKSSPAGFNTDLLPEIPDEYSPRQLCWLARRERSCLPRSGASLTLQKEMTLDYRVDITRDINGVGLLYFTTYFSVIDRALLELWRALQRSDQSFLGRAVRDQKVCFLGNVDNDSTMTVRVSLWSSDSTSGTEIYSVVIGVAGTDRVVAVASVELERGGA